MSKSNRIGPHFAIDYSDADKKVINVVVHTAGIIVQVMLDDTHVHADVYEGALEMKEDNGDLMGSLSVTRMINTRGQRRGGKSGGKFAKSPSQGEA